MISTDKFNRVTAFEEGIQHLYKFRSLNDHDISEKHTENIFTHNNIYFASISEFNDPFDSRCYFFTDLPDKDRFDFLYEKFKIYLDHPMAKAKFGYTLKNISPGNKYDKRYRKFISQEIKGSEDIKAQRISFDNIVKECGIFSMSKNNNNILLWSHYANSHAGICIEFKVDEEFFGHASKITYSDDYPKVDYLKNIIFDKNQADKAILTKSKLWQYEEEYRIILVSEPPPDPFSTDDIVGHHEIREFPEELLTGVILGCSISEENKKE